MKNHYKFYVVLVGRKVGIFFSYDEAQKQVHRFKGAIHKGFDNASAARKAIAEMNINIEDKDYDAPQPAPLW